jgi:hypothetical protein
MEVLYGVHPVEEALKAGKRKFDHVIVARERDDLRLEKLVALCRQLGIRVLQESREQLTLRAQTPAHQGVVAMVRPLDFLSIEDLFAAAPAVPVPHVLFSRSMESKTRRTSALCCAWPMARASTEWSSPSGARPRSVLSQSRRVPAQPNISASRASSTSCAPLKSSSARTSGSSGSTNARRPGRLRRLRLHRRLRPGPRPRRRRPARTRPPHLRPPAAHSHGRRRQLAQRLCRGRRGPV